ncbi:uncharacterized protein LOC131875765 [Cryptomeria japonica]|uniref:uncharacterized protein LOC131875765 n=1 Tax=Cryptomeria japonica TaxID=3369 RepID=UPI0027DA8A70|nr:uncharacterized protein LOC131875765 [Cryptomeria japonica]
MEEHNEKMQEKCACQNEMQRIQYHARKDIINKRRRENQHILLDEASTFEFSSSNNPFCLPSHPPQLQQIIEPNLFAQMQPPSPFSQNYYIASNKFRSKLDNLSNMSTCLVCMERYPNIKTKKYDGITTSHRCTLENNGHRFSKWNNMDLDQQPICLQRLSQIEGMLIARVSPVLQVTYARGGQLKYSDHTICFPRDITTIASYLSRRIHELDIIIINRESIGQEKYKFYVSRDRVHEALKYKMINDPYYKDVKLDELALTYLPISSTDISNLLYATISTTNPGDAEFMQSDIIEDDALQENMESRSSFVENILLALREVEEVCSLLQLGKGQPTPTLNWPPISLSPINEYTTEGLFAMVFPTLFPKGSTIFKQQRIKEVKLHEYALHLLRYHDNRFGQYPRFRYFILNILMCH